MSVLSKIIGVEKLNRSQTIVVTASTISLAIWTYNVIKKLQRKRSVLIVVSSGGDDAHSN